ncbi:MAG: hypothetical protein JWP37_3706, partial [Mucilaginibacter sp.]|nr:hypothetical protein [Mucilaginibacter sp.]
NPNNIFTFGTIIDNIPADGVSLITIPAQVNTSLPAASQSVTFTTDAGSFTNGSAAIPADPSGNLKAYLKSSVVGPAHVSATCSSITRTVTVNFVSAVPDYLLLTGNGTVTNGSANTLTISIAAKRNIGTRINVPGDF